MGTRSLHQVRSCDVPGKLHVRTLTCLCTECLAGNVEPCANQEIVEEWKEHSLIPAMSNTAVEESEQMQNDEHDADVHESTGASNSTTVEPSTMDDQDPPSQEARTTATEPVSDVNQWGVNTCLVVQYPDRKYPGIVKHCLF